MKENDMNDNNAGPPEENICERSGASKCANGNAESTNPPARSARPPRAKYKHRNHRRTGKVARLPAAVRNEICLRFTRYQEYKDIVAWLASQGHPNISHSNLSRWRKGGFLDWLRNEQKKRLDLIELTLDVLDKLSASEQQPLSPKTSETHSAHSSTNPLIHSSRLLPPLLDSGSFRAKAGPREPAFN